MIHYQDNAVTLHAGDCLDILRELPDNSVDAVVTDPPAGISFMSRSWDDERPMTVAGTPRRVGDKTDVGYGGEGGASRFFTVVDQDSTLFDEDGDAA